MLSRVARVIATAVLGAAVAAAGAVPASATTVRVHTGFGVVPAPTRQAAGLVYGPYATCGGARETPPDSYQLLVTRGGHVVARSAAGYAVVTAGTYRVRATLTCGRTVRTVAATLTVVELTDAQTVNESEFAHVRPGQSVSKVAQIIGGPLDPTGREAGTQWFTKLNTTSGLSLFEFRGGRLVSRQWSTGQD